MGAALRPAGRHVLPSALPHARELCRFDCAGLVWLLRPCEECITRETHPASAFRQIDVRVGSDREQSGTARENLAGSGMLDVPDELPDVQKKLVDYAVPGLREVLGYS